LHLAFLILNRWFKLRMMGVPVTLLLLAALIYDATLDTTIHPLQPALQSYWRSIHVPIILLSYALFTLAFLSSLVFLIKPQAKAETTDSLPSSTAPTNLELELLQDKASVYDEITYRCVAFGFPMLALGIILGGIWANEAWGNYWSWDPKESMSLV